MRRASLLIATVLIFLGTVVAQVSVAPLPYARVQFLSGTGVPLAGGHVHTYQAGGTVPQATYTDYSGLVANANPVVLDAGGFADIWLAPLTYNIVVENAAGVLQWSVDGLKSPTGTLTVAGLTVTGNLAVGGNLTVTGTGAFGCVPTLNKIRYANCFAGANAGVKIAAAWADLAATGGTVDGRGLEGAQVWSADPFSGVTKQVEVWLPVGVTTISANTTVPSNVRLIFAQGSEWSVSNGVTITYNGGIDAPLSKIFTLVGTGRVDFSTTTRLLEVYPQWWGAVGQKQTHHVLSTAANTTITISDKHDPFVSSDVGKTIRVILRNVASLEDFETTISSFISATQVVIGAAPTITSTTGEAYWFPSTENATAAIQAAINSRAGTLHFVKGVYVTSGAISNVRATVKLLGDGTRSSIVLMRKSATSDSFTLTDTMHPTLESFTVVGPGMDATAGGAIRIRHTDFDNVDGLKINDVLVSHIADSGFAITTPILSTIMNSKVLFGAGHGFHIMGGTTTDLINDYAITLVGAGILIEDSAAIMGVQGGATESAGIGILIRDSYSVTVDHYDTEAQIDRSFAAPAAAPLLSATAGGTVTPGTYYWQFAWMHGVAPGPESAESLQLTVTGGANQTITANLGTVPAGVHVARIYSTLVGGASGSEGFLKDVTGLTPGTTGYATKTSPITVGAVPPTFWYDGHGYVVSNSKKVSINNSHSRDLPITDSRHYLITDNSSEVSIARPRIVQGGTTPTFDVELTAGVADNELLTSLAIARILNSGTNTVVRTGAIQTVLALRPVAWGSLGTPLDGTFVWCVDCTITSPCAGAGTGAFAKRLNGAWICN
jgi:hypothetical protein